MAQKLYGENKVFCEGRFISGPDARSSVLSVLMILVPSILWQVVVGSFFAIEYSWLIPLLAAGLQLSSIALLLATAMSDPGIMPRQPDFSQTYDEHTKVFRTREPQRFYDLVLRGHPFKLKYCKTCHIYRPPRCVHCSVCENCVERFDHHCPWLGNCIGKRNYWLFYCFVSATGLLNIIVLTTSVAQLGVRCTQLQEEEGLGAGDAFGAALLEAPVAAVLSIYALGIVWFTFGLCMYHNFLVCTNQTTYEHMKGAYSDSANPFCRGILGNYRDVLLSHVRPRFFNAYTGRLLWPPRGMSLTKEVGVRKHSLPEEKMVVDKNAMSAMGHQGPHGSVQAAHHSQHHREQSSQPKQQQVNNSTPSAIQQQESDLAPSPGPPTEVRSPAIEPQFELQVDEEQRPPMEMSVAPQAHPSSQEPRHHMLQSSPLPQPRIENTPPSSATSVPGAGDVQKAALKGPPLPHPKEVGAAGDPSERDKGETGGHYL